MQPQPVSPRIDDPMALLLACHDKVRRFSDLLLRLRDHLVQHGADGQARDAARSILRYFDLAAPLHHADEDTDLYPALLALEDAAVTQRILALSTEHEVQDAQWRELSAWLRALAADEQPTEIPHALIDTFASHQTAHAEAEERDVYPAACRLPASTLARIAQAMVERRSQPG